MSLSETISQRAAHDPAVAAAVAAQTTKSALLTGLQTGDAALGSLLAALSGQSVQADQLLASLTPNLGQHVNTGA